MAPYDSKRIFIIFVILIVILFSFSYYMNFKLVTVVLHTPKSALVFIWMWNSAMFIKRWLFFVDWPASMGQRLLEGIWQITLLMKATLLPSSEVVVSDFFLGYS